MSDTNTSARAAIEAIIARDGLRLSDEELERLVNIYPETQAQLATLRLPGIGETEPAIVYRAS